MSPAELAELIAGFRYSWRDEADLQAGIACVLADAGLTVERELLVAPRCRVDLHVDRVGIEVKVKGNAESVLRQLQRYAESDALDAFVLATTRAAHLALPATVGGKPISIAYLTHLA